MVPATRTGCLDSEGYCSFGYYHGNPPPRVEAPAPAPAPGQHSILNSSPGTSMTQSTTHPYSSSNISDAVQHILDKHRDCVVDDDELVRLVKERLIICHGSSKGDGRLTDYKHTTMRTENPRRHKCSMPRVVECNDPFNHAYSVRVSICWDKPA